MSNLPGTSGDRDASSTIPRNHRRLCSDSGDTAVCYGRTMNDEMERVSQVAAFGAAREAIEPFLNEQRLKDFRAKLARMGDRDETVLHISFSRSAS